MQQGIAFPTPGSVWLFGIVQDAEGFMRSSADPANDRLFIRLHPVQTVRAVKNLVSSSVQPGLSQHQKASFGIGFVALEKNRRSLSIQMNQVVLPRPGKFNQTKIGTLPMNAILTVGVA